MTERGLSGAFSHGRPALVAYLMAGYPTRAESLAALRVLAEAGADLIELGVPYSDPLADGPVIRDAADAARAAAGGAFGLAETIDLAREFIASGKRDAPPVALMTYLNPLMRMGLPKAAIAMREAGIGGVIVPDLPPDMAGPWLAASEGIDTVFLAAPTSTPERLAKVGEMSRGFVYCVSSTGVTGERAELPDELVELVERVKAATAASGRGRLRRLDARAGRDRRARRRRRHRRQRDREAAGRSRRTSRVRLGRSRERCTRPPEQMLRTRLAERGRCEAVTVR